MDTNLTSGERSMVNMLYDEFKHFRKEMHQFRDEFNEAIGRLPIEYRRVPDCKDCELRLRTAIIDGLRAKTDIAPGKAAMETLRQVGDWGIRVALLVLAAWALISKMGPLRGITWNYKISSDWQVLR